MDEVFHEEHVIMEKVTALTSANHNPSHHFLSGEPSSTTIPASSPLPTTTPTPSLPNEEQPLSIKERALKLQIMLFDPLNVHIHYKCKLKVRKSAQTLPADTLASHCSLFSHSLILPMY